MQEAQENIQWKSKKKTDWFVILVVRSQIALLMRDFFFKNIQRKE